MLMQDSYKIAGVDIEAGDETVSRIKGHARATFTKGVLTDIGMFGAFYQPDFSQYSEPVLVSSVDGVGTKLKIAILLDKHDTIGRDLVNHCVNDIAVCGAEPLFFLDYFACGKLIPEKAEKIIKGFADACKENDCALIGGETAEMPGLYSEEDYDLSGTIVGIVEKSKIIDGRDISEGDIMIGIPSSGLHTNGYSLARKVLLEKYSVFDYIEGFQQSIGEILLTTHKSYLKLIRELKNNFHIKGFSHITGGGIEGNTYRIVKGGLKLSVAWDSWDWPIIFKLIQQTGNITNDEMRRVFNLGIGLVAIVDPNDVEAVLQKVNDFGEDAKIIGKITR